MLDHGYLFLGWASFFLLVVALMLAALTLEHVAFRNWATSLSLRELRCASKSWDVHSLWHARRILIIELWHSGRIDQMSSYWLALFELHLEDQFLHFLVVTWVALRWSRCINFAYMTQALSAWWRELFRSSHGLIFVRKKSILNCFVK